MTQTKKKKRSRRRLKKQVFLIPAVLLALLAAALIPGYRLNSKLKALGYNKAQIAQIKEYKLTDTLLNNGYYSAFLAKSLENQTFQMDYLPLYLVMDEDTVLTEDDFLLYNRLEDIGYETDQLQNLFQHLTFREMTPLLVFDYQYNEEPYIEDCTANRESNADGSFSLTNSYIAYYNKPNTVSDINDVTVLVNKKNLLTENDVPSNMVTIDTTYAIEGIQLSKEAGDAFTSMAVAASRNGHYIYAVTGYRSYSDQDMAYQIISYYNGEDYAELYAARAGASEHQTGLAVNLSIVGEESAEFSSTASYQWLKENAAQYGFIERYPQGKTAITGFPAEADHYRYVGSDLANAVNASGLTFEEYYGLYLAPWNDESYQPSFLQEDTEIQPTASSEAE